MREPPADDEVELAERLLRDWDEGRGEPKSQLEIRTWGDATAHGRHFDRFVRRVLGVSTNRPSRQSQRIAGLESQVRGLGGIPVGGETKPWEVPLQQARQSCLAALRVWNDPMAPFRTGAFSRLFVTGWDSLAIALAQRAGKEWRQINDDGSVRIKGDGEAQSRAAADIVAEVFPGSAWRGLRENVQFWVDLRDCVAHRHLPALDLSVIPQVQAGLLNIEATLVTEFGSQYTLGQSLSVPLPLFGFRDPAVLASRKKLQASLPPDIQAIVGRAETASPELLADPTFMMRVAFIPVVPGAGRNPDAVAYFVKPGALPTELAEALDHYVVLPKVSSGSRPNFAATEVIAEVERRTSYTFTSQVHADAARHLGARPPKGEADRTVDIRYAEYITSSKRYLYSQAWIDRLVAVLAGSDGFPTATGTDASAPGAHGN